MKYVAVEMSEERYQDFAACFITGDATWLAVVMVS
jgi:hypothetical protein